MGSESQPSLEVNILTGSAEGVHLGLVQCSRKRGLSLALVPQTKPSKTLCQRSDFPSDLRPWLKLTHTSIALPLKISFHYNFLMGHNF